jgi:hypothetical protein
MESSRGAGTEGGPVILSGINLEVKEEESVVIVGPVGCGKSLLAAMLHASWSTCTPSPQPLTFLSTSSPYPPPLPYLFQYCAAPCVDDSVSTCTPLKYTVAQLSQAIKRYAYLMDLKQKEEKVSKRKRKRKEGRWRERKKRRERRKIYCSPFFSSHLLILS